MEKLITVGEIGAAVGVHGEVRVRPLTDFPERFQTMDEIIVVQKERKLLLKIEDVNFRNKQLLLKFEEINTKEDARKLSGAYLMIPENSLVPLPPGEFYVYQLLGLPVVEDRTTLGELAEVITTGSNDVYLVRNHETGEEILVPAIKQVVLEINIKGHYIKVKLPPGLRD